MRLSMTPTSVSGHGQSGEAAGHVLLGGLGRRLTLLVTLVLVLGCIGTLISPAKKAGADTTVYQSGQVFASVGFSQVNIYDPGSGDLVNTLTDDTSETYTAGSAFDSSGNFYVTDDLQGDVSEFSPSGQPMGQFATGLQNPLSLVFDNQGNLYVGQQTTPYIAEYSATGQRLPDIGPVQTELYGDDWIDLASDECTFYYTTEGTDILRYNKCSNTQESNFNQVPFSGPAAFEVRILQNGEVLVADSTAVLLLDQNGNVIQTYSCSSLPGCQGQLFAVAVDPSGTSFWTADSYSGDVWQVNMATGAVMQTINTNAGFLYGLSVDDEQMAATTAPITTTPTTLTINPVTGNFSSPTPVSGTLTNTSTGAAVANEPVTFTLNGSESCTGTTNSSGYATCTITPSEPSNSYTLTASFSGDTTTSTPIGSDSSSSTFTVNPDTSGLTYTGPTSAVNGQPITLTGTLTTNTPTTGTPLPTKVVTLTIGSGSSAQSCSGTTDENGDVSCTIATVDQPSGSEPIIASFAGDVYDTSANASGTLSVTEPTTLTVNAATGSYGSPTTLSGVLTDANTGLPVSGETVTFTTGTQSCTGTTDATGTASCSITPTEAEGSYTVSGSFTGDSSQPVPLTGSTNSAAFTVTPATTTLTYTGGSSVTNGQSITLSGVLTSGGSDLSSQPVTLTLGSGSSAQSCSGTTSSSGVVSCSISDVNQPVGPTPVVGTYAGNTYYQSASSTGSVQVGPSQVSTSLTVAATTGTYGSPVTVSATLTNDYTNTPASGQTVTLKLNGTQSCSATTNASGVASCSITPNEPGGTYTLSAAFGGNTTTVPTLLSSTGSNTFTENKAPDALTYTGSTSTTSGTSPTLSATLTANGTPLSGQTVTFTVGSGSSAQKCSGTTNSAGNVSCSICMFNQSVSPLPVTVSYAGSAYISSGSTSVSVTVNTPTTLSVSAVTGTYGQPTTVTGTLTNRVTGQPISGQTITLTLNGTQSCTATTGSNGKGSCPVTPTESAGTYGLSGSFAGNTSTSPPLLTSSGSNNFVVSAAPTSITYTGPTSVTAGSSATLSAELTNSGTGLNGQTVTITLGTGKSAQSCTGTTNSSGAASCTIANVDQITGSVAVTVSYTGNGYYASSSNSSSVSVKGSGGGSGGGSSGGSSGGQGGGSTGPKGGSPGGGGCPGM
jgi:hypothetical protein